MVLGRPLRLQPANRTLRYASRLAPDLLVRNLRKQEALAYRRPPRLWPNTPTAPCWACAAREHAKTNFSLPGYSVSYLVQN